MKIFYITLNSNDDAKKISKILLENRIAVCTNWFPIQCAYRWQGEIKQGEEVVLIVKTTENRRADIEKVIASHIGYTNFIAELNVQSVNEPFAAWLKAEVV